MARRGVNGVCGWLPCKQADHYPAIAFTYYLQYHLHLQLLTVSSLGAEHLAPTRTHACARSSGNCLDRDVPHLLLRRPCVVESGN